METVNINTLEQSGEFMPIIDLVTSVEIHKMSPFQLLQSRLASLKFIHKNAMASAKDRLSPKATDGKRRKRRMRGKYKNRRAEIMNSTIKELRELF